MSGYIRRPFKVSLKRKPDSDIDEDLPTANHAGEEPQAEVKHVDVEAELVTQANSFDDLPASIGRVSQHELCNPTSWHPDSVKANLPLPEDPWSVRAYLTDALVYVLAEVLAHKFGCTQLRQCLCTNTKDMPGVFSENAPTATAAPARHTAVPQATTQSSTTAVTSNASGTQDAATTIRTRRIKTPAALAPAAGGIKKRSNVTRKPSAQMREIWKARINGWFQDAVRRMDEQVEKSDQIMDEIPKTDEQMEDSDQSMDEEMEEADQMDEEMEDADQMFSSSAEDMDICD
ncbi:hypothetical protein FN846DRAFT_893362 [Sphaerosporella brunnea]|uniref:Uncharacterized protein n=1 Tax=Sphaerosporella brunnea TaxID=1250544 RepID=A0A5J5EL55_9PEZI|nr:hypothetical protein FN846DRAFT_893362 [Sphaerosporella brunnea]